MKKVFATIFLTCFTLFLAACGGGGGGVQAPGISTKYTVTLSPQASTVSSTTPITLLATLTDVSGVPTPVANASVIFAVPVGTVSGSLTKTTNASGVASLTVNANSAAEAQQTIRAVYVDSDGNVATGTGLLSSSGGGTAPDDGTTPTPELAIGLSLVNAAGAQIGTSALPLSSENSGRLVATLTNGGVGVAGEIVNFSVSGIGGNLSQPSGLTDGSGVIEVALDPGVDPGAGTATVSATVGGKTVSSFLHFASSGVTTIESAISLGFMSDVAVPTTFTAGALNISPGSTNIAQKSTVTVTAHLVDTNNSNAFATKPIVVTFTSTCKQQGTAVLDAQVTSLNGVVTATYSPDGCIGSDTITATANGGVLTASVPVTFAAQSVGSIEFLSASPASLALRGTGGQGRSETSEVQFRVLTLEGTPSPGQQLCFALTTEVGSLELGQQSATTLIDGTARVTVRAGTIPTPVRVEAILDSDKDDDCADENPAISVVSDVLVVSTGLPDQNSLSLSVSERNPAAYDHDGVDVDVIVYAADHFNNPVPDGTSVLFWTELGAIQPSCNTAGGTCMVKWISQAPKGGIDVNFDGYGGAPNTAIDTAQPSLRADRNGRSTIIAYMVGEESFTDLNANGLFDGTLAIDGTTLTEADTVDHLSEVIRDKNFDGLLSRRPVGAGAGFTGFFEEYVDFNSDQKFQNADDIVSVPETAYQGVLCNQDPAVAASLDSNTVGEDDCDSLRNIFQRTEISLSTDATQVRRVAPQGMATVFPALVTFNALGAPLNVDVLSVSTSPLEVVLSQQITVSFLVADANNNSMPANTTVAAEVAGEGFTIEGPASYTIFPTTTEPQIISFVVENDAAAAGATLIIKVTVPGGLVTAISYPLTIPAP